MRTVPDKLVRYKATVSYDGTNYFGWQLQPKHKTVQGELERALHQLTRKKIRIYCSGRTDQGVHARGQVIHFDLATGMTDEKLFLAMNAVLPEDIRVESIKRAHLNFDCRMDASEKEYRYFIWNNRVMTPNFRAYRTLVRPKLNISAMKKAASLLVGEHDFAAFSANPRREIGGTVRTITRLSVLKNGNDVVIVAQANGFLYKMVRSLAGFLIRVGMGELPPENAKAILASKKRTAEVPTAAPQGLFLWKVFY